LCRRGKEGLAFILGQIFAPAIVMKEISGHRFPFLSIAPSSAPERVDIPTAPHPYREPLSPAPPPLAWVSEGRALPTDVKGN
jgi:hypothetical protein